MKNYVKMLFDKFCYEIRLFDFHELFKKQDNDFKKHYKCIFY